MKITFDITDSERDIIAEQYAYNDAVHLDGKDEFVLEQFKQFGRTCIASQADRVATESAEVTKKAEVESAKSAISF